ncbi:hypothetical protein GCM10008959_21080 [Deinococcus seoulensis]|uniref:ABC transmembrane type-1 domain-containing protein n=2 Tax=Deinococcus TaxID=1298 RepID=A0ABQ2RVM8_9DEIO|nr:MULTISPECIES: sugar ABC transporter permease [Deinococcus]GGR59041.1 hypothetical protein GCM10008959_21080 [Deinococcus seoulensis]GGS25292.1 hypothetical protein GCM10008961_15910 [Deinococcus knuensis]
MSIQTRPVRTAAARTTRAPGRRGRRQEWLWCYLFLTPFLLTFLAFTAWPALATLTWAFTDFRLPSRGLNFTGLANFQELARDPLYWRSFANTLIFALGNAALKLPLSLVLAVLLTRRWIWGKRAFRTVYFLPVLVPTAVAGLIFSFLLNPLNGSIPAVLRDLGWIDLRDNLFFGSHAATMMTLIGVSVWQILGQYLIYWIAALEGIPDSLSEAAQIDGASFWQELWFVTLPAIKPFAFIITLLGLVNAFGVFGIVLTLTGGGPGTQSSVMQLWVYSQAFTQTPARYGYISAGSLIFGLLIVTLLVIQTVVTRRQGTPEARA